MVFYPASAAGCKILRQSNTDIITMAMVDQFVCDTERQHRLGRKTVANCCGVQLVLLQRENVIGCPALRCRHVDLPAPST